MVLRKSEQDEKGHEVFGYKEGALLGKNWFKKCLPKKEVADVKKIFKEVLGGNIKSAESHENQIVTKKGECRLIRWYNIDLRDEKGKKIGILSSGNDITKRREIEQKLQNEQRFSEAAINSLPGIFYLFGQKGKFLKWNKNFELVSGYSAKEIEKLNPLSFFTGGDKKNIEQAIKQVLKGKLTSVEASLKTKKGKKIPHYFTGMKMTLEKKPYLVGMGIDISEKKEAEEQLMKEKERFQALFESSRDAIMTLEPPTWRFTSGNPSTVEMFTCDSENDFVSRAPWQYSPPKQVDGKASGPKAKAMIMKAMKNGSNFFEWTHRRKGGEDFPATVLLTRLSVGNQTFLQATVRDISERKAIEKKVEEKIEQMKFSGRANLKRYKEMMNLKKENERLKKRLEKLAG